jgi:DNA topoisomerase-1
MKYLIVVESPSKTKKIEGYLKKCFPEHNFIVKASVGHIKKLVIKNKGIDIKNNYKPIFSIDNSKKKVVSDLKKVAKTVDKVIIATDLDAEGEKIGYDIIDILKLDINDNNRIIFNAITERDIKKAFENPTKINMNLLHSQFARRVLDRLIGFEISPITAKKIQSGVSAGRVLSTTTKLVKEKEDEVNKKKLDNYFTIQGDFKYNNKFLKECKYEKNMEDEKSLTTLFNQFKNSTFKIKNITKKDKKSSPPPPFITTTVNQASPYSIRKTSAILQKLYQKGYTTYIRTDSTYISNTALSNISKYIEKNYGKTYIKIRSYNKKVKNAQEAHECIRPTDMNRIPTQISNLEERKLYNLIWKRTMASQMIDAEYESNKIEIKPSKTKNVFEKIINDFKKLGWKKVYEKKEKDEVEEDEDKQNEEDDVSILKILKKNVILDYVSIHAIEKYHEIKGRYTEGGLVKKMEDLGIGRPSTYASTIFNIQEKHYVEKKNIIGQPVKSLNMILKDGNISKNHIDDSINGEYNKLIITDLGIKVTKFLEEKFNMIMDYDFTSNVETDLDKIRNGEDIWYKVVDKYYKKFHPQVENIKKSLKNKKNEDTLIGKYKNKNFYRFNSRWGPRIMYGEKGDKSTLYLIPNKKLLSDVTLEDSISLLPKIVGKYKKKNIEIHKAKTLYFKYNNKNYPFYYTIKNKKKEEITLTDAIMSIEEYIKKKKYKNIKKS